MKYSIPILKANKDINTCTKYSERALMDMANAHLDLSYDKKEKTLWLKVKTKEPPSKHRRAGVI